MASLRRLHIDPEIFELVQRALKESHGNDKRDRERAITRLRNEADRLQQQLDTLYVDRLDGRVTLDVHDRMAKLWREERARCLRDLEALSGANDGFVDEDIALLDFARGMHIGFSQRSLAQKRTALKSLVFNSSWAAGKLSVNFKQPFAMLEEITAEQGDGGAPDQGKSANVSDLVSQIGQVSIFFPATFCRVTADY